MKKTTKLTALVLALVLTLALALTGCGKKTTTIQIAVPNDTTNEARALLLLEQQGIIKLKDGAGITATKNDIVENPHNVEIVEAEAARLPDMKQDVDYAVINSNYAINAGLNPLKDALAIEGSSSAYGNILCVKEGNENEPKILALKAALESKQVADFISEKYAGSVVSTVTNPTDGYDASVDYAALSGTTISVAASPTPHAEILNVAKEILAEQGKRSGIILSTGGGCVTRPENYPLLHQNGTIFRLTRDLAKLPTEGRPVSQATDLAQLCARREPLYRRFADVTVSNDGALEITVQTIKEALL